LTSDSYRVVNGANLGQGTIPRDVSFGWLVRHSPFDWFDVLHIHAIERCGVDDVASVARLCAHDGRRIVFTAHDVWPIFGDAPETYWTKVRTLAQLGAHVVCLTAGSAMIVAQNVEVPEGRLHVVPHGRVVDPRRIDAARAVEPSGTVRYAMLGALRPNRAMLVAAVNVLLGLPADAHLEILMRAAGPAEVERQHAELMGLVTLSAAHAGRIRLNMRPFATDEEVVALTGRSDVLVMPYLCGSHSGQLELAFDADLVPVLPRRGFYEEQRALHGELVPDPMWFDVPEGAEHLFGENLLRTLLEVHDLCRGRQRPHVDAGFAAHREREREMILRAYGAIYGTEGASRQ